MTNRMLATLLSALFLLSSAGSSQDKAPEPPAPAATAAVQKLLDEAVSLGKEKKTEEALRAADRALAAAKETKDSAGEARAHRERALRLEELKRLSEAVGAWAEAAVAWERVGDGPGRVEALAMQSLLSIDESVGRVREPLSQAVALTRAEKTRPLAAAKQLSDSARAFAVRQKLEEARQAYDTALKSQEEIAPVSLDVARSLSGLGYVAWNQRDFTAARDYYRKALESNSANGWVRGSLLPAAEDSLAKKE